MFSAERVHQTRTLFIGTNLIDDNRSEWEVNVSLVSTKLKKSGFKS